MADSLAAGIHRCGCRVCLTGSDEELVEYHRSVNRVMAELDERSRRLFAGLLARHIGRGGIERLFEITGLSRMTIRRGLRECEQGQTLDADRIRRPGGGRKPIEKKHLR